MGHTRCWWWMKLRTRCPTSMIQRLRRFKARHLHPFERTPLEVPGALQPLKLMCLTVAQAEGLALAEVLVLALAALPMALAGLRTRGCWGAFCRRRWLWNAA